MRKPTRGRKLLIASVGVATINYVAACGGDTHTSGNLIAPPGGSANGAQAGAHGVFGFTFLDWACERFSDEEKARLGVSADLAIRFLYSQWVDLHARRHEPRLEDDVLGWMQTDDYLKLAFRSMQTLVIDPLEARGIPIQAQLSEFQLTDDPPR